MTKQKTANLRICASCEWIFRFSDTRECPKCGFASYGARWVCGNAAYRYEYTQELWLNKKVSAYRSKLLDEIADTGKANSRKEIKRFIFEQETQW